MKMFHLPHVCLLIVGLTAFLQEQVVFALESDGHDNRSTSGDGVIVSPECAVVLTELAKGTAYVATLVIQIPPKLELLVISDLVGQQSFLFFGSGSVKGARGISGLCRVVDNVDSQSNAGKLISLIHTNKSRFKPTVGTLGETYKQQQIGLYAERGYNLAYNLKDAVGSLCLYAKRGYRKAAGGLTHLKDMSWDYLQEIMGDAGDSSSSSIQQNVHPQSNATKAELAMTLEGTCKQQQMEASESKKYDERGYDLAHLKDAVGYLCLAAKRGYGKAAGGLTHLKEDVSWDSLQEIMGDGDDSSSSTQKMSGEQSSSTHKDEFQTRIEQQQQKIQELQAQLADFLNAHNELEQLQQDTEAAVEKKYKVRQLKESVEEYKSLLKLEREEKVMYEKKAREAELKLYDVMVHASRLEQTLNQSVAEYQAQLIEEKGKLTYYENIETRSIELEEHQQQIKDMERTHEEVMLIATNSVDASQKREENLLMNIEELEGELATTKKARDDTQESLEGLQAQLDKMQQNAASAAAAVAESNKSKQDMSQQNKELTLKVQQLECKFKDESKEKEQILADKTRLENEVSKLIFVPRRVRKLIAATTATTSTAEEGEMEASKGVKRVVNTIGGFVLAVGISIVGVSIVLNR